LNLSALRLAQAGGRWSALLNLPSFPKQDKTMIQPSPLFKDNLRQLPPIDKLNSIEVLDESGKVIAVIENKPGKQGSLAVYQYLQQTFATLDTEAATHGLAVFAEHTEDARKRPGAHPNIDLLFGVIAGDSRLNLRLIAA
jgi:hypothetical protein